jgi:hypothetical protein
MLGTCPFCDATIPARLVLIEYEREDGPAAGRPEERHQLAVDGPRRTEVPALNAPKQVTL